MAVRKGTRARERVYRPHEQLPLIITLPAFPAPFMLYNLTPPKRFKGGHWTPFLPSREFLDSIDAEGVETEDISPMRFARLLAKIAHGITFAWFGFDNIQPLLPDLILGRCDRFLHLVGGSLYLQPPQERSIFVGIRPHVRFDGAVFVLCDIRLFAHLSAPYYTVVVGQMVDSWNTLDELQATSSFRMQSRYQTL